ncbi:MAG: SDR family oxidoreductase [Mobilitalea sp.]
MELFMMNKVAVVVGGGGGSGRIIAQEFGRQGAKVVVADMDGEKAISNTNEIKKIGGEAIAFTCNIRNEDEVKALMDFAVETYGRIDVGINIVGTNTDFTDITNVPTEHFDLMYEINQRGIYFCMKYELLAMKNNGKGAIINMGSAGSLIGQRGQGVYNPTKFAVAGITKSAALDFAKDNIRINCVCPGPMMSDGMKAALEKDPHFADQYLVDVPMGRFVEQQEVANAFVFLASDLASGITGVALPVDCGMVAD